MISKGTEITMKIKQAAQVRTAGAHRVGWRVAGVILLTAVVVAGLCVWAEPAFAADPDRSQLVGRWMRTDGGYILELSDPVQGGLLMAAYFNPRPINVSRAEWKLQDGYLGVFVELTDKHYAGSTYTLVYNPNTDRLVGVYFQATLRQEFEVEFKRTK
jgi:hypothetical protein